MITEYKGESPSWVPISIFLVGVFIGIAVTSLFVTLDNSSYFKVSIMQTRQEVFSLPNGTTWKKIRTAEDVR